MRVNYNISAMIANNALKMNDNKLTESTKRLSTGMKVAGAKDNPSGLAMARRMNAQIRSLDRSTDNASDGISVIQTADGALNEVHDILQRMNELSIQAANGLNSASDLQNIQDEIVQLKDEITRISEATEFNGQKLLNGTFDYKGYATVAENPADANTQITEPKVTLNSYSDMVDDGIYVIGGYSIVNDTTQGNVLKTGSNPPDDDDILHAEYDERTGEVTLFDKDGNVAEDLHISVYRGRRYYDTTSTPPGEKIEYELYMQKAQVTTEGDKVLLSTLDGKSMEIKLNEDFNRKDGKNIDNADIDTINLELTGTGPMTMQIGANEGLTLDIRIPPISLSNLGLEYVDFTRTVQDDINTNLNHLTTSEIFPVASKDDNAANNPAPAAWNDVKTYGKYMETMADELWKYVGDPATATYEYIDKELAGQIQAIRSDARYATDTAYYEERVKALYDERYRTLYKEINELDVKKDATGKDLSYLEKLSTFMEDHYVTPDFQRKLDKVVKNYADSNPTPPATPIIQPGDPNYIEFEWQAGMMIDDILHASYDTGRVAPHTGADDGITAIGNAIKKVSQIRSQLGAYQNRLEHTVKANDGTSENMTAAYSRIMDVDMAEEMTVYSTQQVLSQAGTSMLAQANERPSQILQLLQ
ncbi:MAG: hypothetical protein IJT34_07145 [Butyrivibrio sp.]|nr:hypothetical protein [Butyrivibrio sp.]